MSRVYVAPISFGLGDLVVSLPVVQALITQARRTGGETWLVARSSAQTKLAERIEGLGLTVIKRDGFKEPYDRGKVVEGIEKALKNRPVTKEQVTVTEPIEGGTADIVHPSSLGGTRHLSAAQFAHDQQDAIALVASQDGHFTVFAWSPCENMVHAHRVEALLL